MALSKLKKRTAVPATPKTPKIHKPRIDKYVPEHTNAELGIFVRFDTPATKQRVVKAAAAAGVSTTEFIRAATLAKL